MHGKSGLVAGDNAGKWVCCLKSGDGVGGGKESLNACWCLLSLTNVIYNQGNTRFSRLAYLFLLLY